MEFHRGLVRAYDPATHTAAVLLAGSMSRTILGVPVAQEIPAAHMLAGTPCTVAFFAEGSQSVVLSTFGVPPPPATTLYTYEDTGTDLTLSTSWQTVPNLSITITPPTPHTWTVILMAQIVLRSLSATAEYAEHYAQFARDGSLVGTMAQAMITTAYEGCTIPLLFKDTVTYAAPRTYTIQAKKSGGSQTKAAAWSRMTIIALRTA